MKLKIISSEKLVKNKTVFLRVDFNEPQKNGKLEDETKIIRALPTIRYLLRYNCRIILATHLGEPGGKKLAKYSCKFLAVRLNEILGGDKVKFCTEAVGDKTDRAIKKLQPGEILFLENLRFNIGEEENNLKFAKRLAAPADIYINDAFSVCHRAHASISAIRKYLPSYAGFLLQKEIAHLDKIRKPLKPMIILMGGAKIKTKINLIKNLQGKAADILIGGALANNFFKAKGLNIGKSLFDKESVLIAKKLLANKKIILPVDVIVGRGDEGEARMIDKVGNNDVILDIGPKTIMLFSTIIRKAKTLVWNGPMGAFEKPHFRHGTVALGQLVAARARGKTFGVVGGGETLEALAMTKMEDYVDWVSTGGGAMLSYLGGEKMPGLQ